MPKRLLKLALTLDRLREVLAARSAALQQEGQELLRKRARLEALMMSDTRFLDLTLGGGLKRLSEISARLSAIDQARAALRRRSADAFLKAKRARQTAAARRAEAQGERARLELSELGDREAARKLAASE